MGAMLIGMITGGIAWICFIIINLLLASLVFIDAYRHKMKAVIWAIMVLLFNLYAIPVYIIVRIKIARLKCGSCGTKVKNSDSFCSACGNAVKKIDDGAIAKKVILYVLAAFMIFEIIGMLYIVIVSELNP